VLTRLRSTRAYARLSAYPTVHQFVRYALVGALNVVVMLGIFNLLLLSDLHPNVAQAVAFLITTVQGFYLHKTWAFRDEGRHPPLRGYLVFLALTVVGLGINQAAFTLFLVPLGRYGLIGKNVASLAAVPFSVVWNFMAYRTWTFRPAAPAASSRSPGSFAR